MTAAETSKVAASTCDGMADFSPLCTFIPKFGCDNKRLQTFISECKRLKSGFFLQASTPLHR